MLTSKLKAHLIIVTAFTLGVAVGASGQYLLSNHTSPRPASTVTDVSNELSRVLTLDLSQRAQVSQILGECQRRSQELKDQTRPQFQGIRDNARDRIRAILSEEQRSIYNQWLKDLDSKREKRAHEEGKQKGK